MPRGDTISRYENYDMHSISSPRRKNPDAPSAAKGVKDTIETSLERSERLAPPKINPGDNRASQDRLVQIGRAGRFVFMAITLPPYFLLYGMPKWVAVNLGPKLINMMTGAGELGKDIGANIKAWFVNNIMNPFRDAFGKINFAIQGLMKGMAGFFANMQAALFKPFQLAAQLIQKLSEQAQKLFQMPSKLFDRTFEALSKILHEAVSACDKALHAVKAPFIKAGEAFTSLGQMISNLAKQIETRASDLGRKIAEIAKVGGEKIRTAFEKGESALQFIAALPASAVVPVINFFIQTKSVVSEWGKFSLRRVKKSGQSIFQRGQKKLKSALDSGKKFLGYLPKKAKEQTKKALQWVRGPLVEFIREEIPFLVDACTFIRWVYNQILLAIKARVIRVQQFVKKAILKGEVRLRKMTTFCKKYAHAFLAFVKRPLNAIVRPLLQMSKRAGRTIRSWGKAFAGLFKELHQEMRSWMP
jgi:hypothetical protein